MHEAGELHADPPITYFTCTLGQAALINQKAPHDFSNINEFIDRQARLYPDHLAVGSPDVEGKGENNVLDSMLPTDLT